LNCRQIRFVLLIFVDFFLLDPEEQNQNRVHMDSNPKKLIKTSVGDPDVFGPPVSESGSGSFYHQAKIVRKP
jgi:hypothetical protein